MKRLLLSSFTVGFYNLVLAQTFTPEVGLSYMVQPNSFYDIKSAGFTYSPRLNIQEYKNSSLSVGLPMTLAFSNFKWLQFTSVDFPIELDYNIGAGSKKGNKKKFGFFFGGGYGLHVSNVRFDPAYSPNYYFPLPSMPAGIIGYNSLALPGWDPICEFGPTLNAGARIRVGQTGKNIVFRFSFMKVLDVPSFLRVPDSYTSAFDFRNTIVMGFGCLFSF